MILLVLFSLINAYTLRGYIHQSQIQDITTTQLHLVDSTTQNVVVEPISSNGNFTFREVDDGEYQLSLISSTLNDSSIYQISIAEGDLQVLKINGLKEQIWEYPIRVLADRKVFVEPKKPRLSDVYTDKLVLISVAGLLLLNVLPKVWQDMSAEDLAILEKQEGFATAFETAHKIASGAK